MNIVAQPDLQGLAAERLRSFAAKLAEDRLPEDTIRELVRLEASWAKHSPVLNGQAHAYEASARILGDLKLLKWRVRADAYGIELESPPSLRRGTHAPIAARDAKETVRKELAATLAEQFSDPLVRRFVRDLEEPRAGSRRRSIRALIADGAELHKRVTRASDLAGDDRTTSLDRAVRPYLQLLPGDGEALVHDEFTGIPLGDIWRYFRFTWSIPQTPIPGRQMFYLVRDRAHPDHAVMGIAALGNSPLVSPLRDEAIGWAPGFFIERLNGAARTNDVDELMRLVAYVEELLTRALSQIELSGLVTAEEVARPTEDVVARLQRRADEFTSRREEALREVSEAVRAGVPLAQQETEQVDYGVPRVSRAILELEGKRVHSDSSEALARRLLVAKKRAFELARLLRSRLVLSRYRTDLTNAATVTKAVATEELQLALGTALLCAKSDRVGTNILEITTCGAVPPYNHLLGGKLVALLLLSPEVADDYRSRYGERPAIISSQLKNAERTKDCTVAWLNTTSLYVVGSSQYERVRLPAGIISKQQEELRYVHLGDTEGYGTIQFSEATVLAVQAALEERHQFRGVNSIFGEGFSPKFRKMRNGMMALGFNPTVLMRHDQQRRMYAVPVWPTASTFLRGEPCRLPDYVRKPGRFRGATERIAAFWRSRWLSSRLNHIPSLDALRESARWTLGEKIDHLPISDRSLKSRPRKIAAPEGAQPSSPGRPSQPPPPSQGPPELRFWRELAMAGPESCADEVPADQLSRLHVPQPLDAFLLSRVRDGYSLVLTGNAGDGKTHLLRRLEDDLRRMGAEVESDATAAMTPGDVTPILRRWKRAHRERRPFCLAANEYPLYLLRRQGATFAPVAEVERQCNHRLAYSDATHADESARDHVLVVDLSLRNPLATGFAGPLFEKLLSQPELRAAADIEPESDLAWNLRHLSHPQVRDRLLQLLQRIASAGHRSTVRELWIWAARLLFGSGSEDRKPVRSPGRLYFSRLFERDERFTLSALLRHLADPTLHSHPRWDLLLETNGVADGWQLDDAPKPLRLDRENFAALKRQFYFEHACGGEVLELDGSAGQSFLKVLREGRSPEVTFKHTMIEAINRAYCPEPFPTMTTQLYLWIGHRYHEQPSHGYVANQGVSDAELQLLQPRLPSRLNGAFDYQSDHVLLAYGHDVGRRVALRVDYALFVALERLAQGLPRQLLPDRELNRLDAFLEQLRRAGVPKTRDFFIHSHDDRTTIQVTLSLDGKVYESVRTSR